MNDNIFLLLIQPNKTYMKIPNNPELVCIVGIQKKKLWKNEKQDFKLNFSLMTF